MMDFDFVPPFFFSVLLILVEGLVLIGICLIQNLEVIPKPSIGYFMLSIPVQFIVLCIVFWLKDKWNKRS